MAFRTGMYPSALPSALKGVLSQRQIEVDRALVGGVVYGADIPKPKETAKDLTATTREPRIPKFRSVQSMVPKPKSGASETGCVSVAEIVSVCSQIMWTPFVSAETREYGTYVAELKKKAPVIIRELNTVDVRTQRPISPVHLIAILEASTLSGTVKTRGLIEAGILQAIGFDRVTDVCVMRCAPENPEEIFNMFNLLSRHHLLDLNIVEGFNLTILMANQEFFWGVADRALNAQFKIDSFLSDTLMSQIIKNFHIKPKTASEGTGADLTPPKKPTNAKEFFDLLKQCDESTRMRLKSIIGFYCYSQTAPGLRSDVRQLLKFYTLKLVKGVDIDSGEPAGREALHEASTVLFDVPGVYQHKCKVYALAKHGHFEKGTFDDYWCELMRGLSLVMPQNT